jgi:hypothetical protein
VCELGIEKDFISIFYIQPTLGTSQRTIHEVEKSYLNDEIAIRELEIIKKIHWKKLIFLIVQICMI